jgi:hypothetical protein
MLAAMQHPHIVGFRAAQRASDGHLCLALEHCECSLYQFIQERVKPEGGCVSPAREARAGAVFSARETSAIALAIASGLAYLHGDHRLMHGDVKVRQHTRNHLNRHTRAATRSTRAPARAAHTRHALRRRANAPLAVRPPSPSPPPPTVCAPCSPSLLISSVGQHSTLARPEPHQALRPRRVDRPRARPLARAAARLAVRGAWFLALFVLHLPPAPLRAPRRRRPAPPRCALPAPPAAPMRPLR